MKKSFILLILSICFIIPLSCTKFKLAKTDITITKADKTTCLVKSEIARKPEERNHGFMERKVIPDGTGMIFVFEKDQILSFWMKNTPHPLSIAFIDSKGRIRDIFDMTPYSLASVTSSVSCRYALEVPQGWFKKNGITIGDTINLDF